MSWKFDSGPYGFAALLLFLAPGAAPQKPSDDEQSLFVSANHEREMRGLQSLKWDQALSRAARKHAQLMAQQDVLSHRLPNEPDLAARAHEAGANFSQIRENIATGPLASAFHNGWMHSPGHRENLLDPDMDSVGIAIVDSASTGVLFAVEDFAHAVEDLSLEDQEKRVGSLLVAHGLQMLRGVEARKTCKLNSDSAGKRRPHFVVEFETPDLSHLPQSLEKTIRSGKYHSAAVGACTPTQASGFTRFRIVVLLY